MIKLFDILAKDPKEEFINTIVSAINEVKAEDDTNLLEELRVRLASLNSQLEKDKFIEIRHFPYFSLYLKKEKADVYIKKISSNWESLIKEIKRIKFERIRITVYRSTTKKEKILSKLLKNEIINEKTIWEDTLIDIIENNICINVHIILDLKKENLN